MIARLIRLILAVELLTGLGIGLLMHTRANWPWVAVVTMTLAWPLLLHGWLIGLQSLTAAWHRHREGQTGAGAPGWLAALQAWWCETLASLRSFVLLMPWLGEQELPSGRDPSRLPVVLVHGYFCNRAIWRPLAHALARQGHCVTSVNLEPPFGGIDDYAAQIETATRALCTRTGQSRVALVGHSMGGLAIRAWLAAPGCDTNRVASVITLGSPHQGTWSAHLGLGLNARQMQPDSAWLRALALRESPALRERFTVITTRHDNIVMPAALTVLPGARLVALEAIGHLSLSQSPTVAALIIDTLARIEAP